MNHRDLLAFFVVSAAVVVTLSGCPGRTTDPVAGETRTFDGMEFQWCPAGTFPMGSPVSEDGHLPNETLHEVTLSHGFWLGKFEVTQAQWKNIMGANPSYDKGKNRPVEGVSWDDVQDFLVILNATTTGATYRLPTEAEWEYACRAGTTTRYYWGNDASGTDIDRFAWYYDNATDIIHRVGKKLPNNWGLYDMSGNVFEWCQDWYGDYPAGPVVDPQGSAPDTNKVYRGGSRDSGAPGCRAAIRLAILPNIADAGLGFRLLRTQD